MIAVKDKFLRLTPEEYFVWEEHQLLRHEVLVGLLESGHALASARRAAGLLPDRLSHEQPLGATELVDQHGLLVDAAGVWPSGERPILLGFHLALQGRHDDMVFHSRLEGVVPWGEHPKHDAMI
jgi:hypothetical protein